MANGPSAGYARIEATIRAWLPTRPDIRAAAVIGSQARTGAYAADSSADYDLLLVTTDPDAYKHTNWLHAFGQVVSAVFDPNDHVAFAYSLDFFTLVRRRARCGHQCTALPLRPALDP